MFVVLLPMYSTVVDGIQNDEMRASTARDDGSRPSMWNAGSFSIHLPIRVSSIGAVASGAWSSTTKTPGPPAANGRPQTAGPSARRPTDRSSAAAVNAGSAIGRGPAHDLVDVAVGTPVVVPDGAAGLLRVAEELDPGCDHRRSIRREVVDDQADDRSRTEEVVIGVTRTVDVDLGAVRGTEPDRLGFLEERLDPEQVAVQRDRVAERVGRRRPDAEEAEPLDHRRASREDRSAGRRARRRYRPL